MMMMMRRVSLLCFCRVIISDRALFESRELAEDNPRIGRNDLQAVSQSVSQLLSVE